MSDFSPDFTQSVERATMGRSGKRLGSKIRFLCPSHDDSTPSADFELDGLVWTCRSCSAGGGIIDLAQRLGVDLPSSAPIGAPQGVSGVWHGKQYVDHWTYRDESGGEIGHVVRYEEGGKKDVIPFFSRSPDGKWGPGGVSSPRPLYGLDRLAARPDAPVIVAEGEKAADAAGRMYSGVVAVTSQGGSSAARRSDWGPLKDRKVVIWPDNDSEGRRYALDVIALLEDAGANVVGVVDVSLLDLPVKGDAADMRKPPGKLPKVNVETYRSGSVESEGQGDPSPFVANASERAVLACAMLGRLSEVVEALDVEDFGVQAHKEIFRAIYKVANDRGAVDYVSVGNALDSNDSHEHVALLQTLGSDLMDPSAVQSYIESLKQHRLRRDLDGTALWLTTQVRKQPALPSDIWSELQGRVDSVGDRKEQGRGPRTMEALMEEFAEQIVTRPPTPVVGLRTGFRDLDDATKGLCAGQLIHIAGRPGMGKSVAAVNICQHVALREGKRAMLFSLEMTSVEIIERIMACESSIDHAKVRSGQMDEMERSCLRATVRKLQKAGMLIDDSSSLSISDLVHRARKAKKSGGLDLLVVDYLGLMTVPKGYDRNDLGIGAISKTLKALAKDLKIPVISVVQLSRACEHRDSKRPILSDLRDSGSLEQDADIIMFVFRPSQYDETKSEREAHLILAKNRGGPIGSIKLDFEGKFMRFSDNKVRYGDPTDMPT